MSSAYLRKKKKLAKFCEGSQHGGGDGDSGHGVAGQGAVLMLREVTVMVVTAISEILALQECH